MMTGKYCTTQGSTYSYLQALYSLVVKELPDSCDGNFTLRLDADEQDLAYRFGVNQSTVSSKWVDVLFTKLSLIYCPEWDQLMKTMPTDFRLYFRKCTIIIDCFEIFMECPASLKFRAQTYSNYKNIILLNTSLVLPHTFQKVGVVEHLMFTLLKTVGCCRSFCQLGDMILADRGFTVQDSVVLKCAFHHV